MSYFERALKKFAQFQYKYGTIILVAAIIFTAFISIGLKDIQLEGDIQEQMPQHLPIYQLNDKIRDTFRGQDTIFILFKLENTEVQEVPKDILNPEIMDYVVRLQDSLEKESKVEGITSIYPAIQAAQQRTPQLTPEIMVNSLAHSPQAQELVSDDRRKMIMMVRADVGSSEDEIKGITNLINEKISSFSKPPGTDIMVTGSAPVQVETLDLLRFDSVYTLAIAFVIIFGLLVVMQRSFKKAGLIAVPLIFGVVWTGGALGWLNIKISFATAGLGAMILGLGVEYGVFMLTRYKEEREKGKKQLASLEVGVPGVGSAIIGSGTTTIVGFLALTLSIIPMMHNLGVSLALGIFFSIIGAVVVEPIVIVLEENFETWLRR